MKLFTRIIEGKKPTILLIHGLYSSSSNWYTLARQMGHKVIMVDLPNHGHSLWFDSFGYRMMVDSIKEIIDEPMVVIGHSMGGRVAMMLAAEYPFIKGLIMIDISPVSTLKIDRAFAIFHNHFLSQLVEAKHKGVVDIEAYLNEIGASKDMTSAVDQAYRQMNIDVVAEYMPGMAKEWDEITSRYGKIDIPAMIIRGSESPYVTDKFAERYSERLANYTLETVQGGSHRLHHEYPDEFLALVKKFMDENF